jgi:hypothetical protein
MLCLSLKNPVFFYTNTKLTMKNFILLMLCLSSSLYLHSQCGSGEVEIEIEINTDSYGSEGYWELVSSDSACGEGTILSGGNISVGCNGAGLQNQPAGGYASNTTITSSTACLLDGTTYRIAYVDDWGDGGFEFFIYINGYLVGEFQGAGGFEYYTFTASEPPAYDLEMLHPKVSLYQQQGSVDIVAEVHNKGTEMITSVELNYSVNSGSTETQTVSGLSIDHNSRVSIAHPIVWNASSNGSFEIKVWHTVLNGSNNDANPVDDEEETTVAIGPPKPNVIDSYLNTLPIVVEIADGADQLNNPTDLDFHPILTRFELWVLNKDTEATGSSTVTISDAGKSNQDELWRRDGNAWHFMSWSTGIAFSENGNFGTSPGIYDANHNGGQAFTGPALWSSDPTVYAQPSGGNGSHLDMLHESPECQGIASETDNVFWVFDGYNKDIVRYDFADDHGPGNDDHSDGRILRFSDEQVKADSDDEVVSHLEYDKSTDWLYVVDHGNQRVFRIDTKSGNGGNTPTYGPFETLAEYSHITNYTSELLVEEGLEQPAGIALMDNYMLVSDYATGEIIVYDITTAPAIELKRLDLQAEGIMGISIGPEGKIWYVDHEAETVNRIDWVPDTTTGIEPLATSLAVDVFPNPSTGAFVMRNEESSPIMYEVFDAMGRSVRKGVASPGISTHATELNYGSYTIRFNNETKSKIHNQQLIITQ